MRAAGEAGPGAAVTSMLAKPIQHAGSSADNLACLHTMRTAYLPAYYNHQCKRPQQAQAGARGVGARVAGLVAAAHARRRLTRAALRMQQHVDRVAEVAVQPRHAVAVARVLRGPAQGKG